MSLLNLIFGAAVLAAPAVVAAEVTPPARDRQAILAMAGDFQVSFEFEEVLTLAPGVEKSPRHLSRGHEKVIVVADEGDFISLQHLLVVGDEKDPQVIKHWRQDWRYEPGRMFVYAGKRTWTPQALAPEERQGAWVQTVFQVDDSPRYAGVGRWQHIGNHSYWESNETWRPLPRREREKRTDYDVLIGRNRHSITPEGWAHEQDNLKMALNPEQVLGREHGQNLYRQISGYNFAPAVEYWEKTEDFWKEVRAWWRGRMEQGGTLTLRATEDSLEPHLRMLELAEKYAEGELQQPQAIHEVLDAELAARLSLAAAAEE